MAEEVSTIAGDTIIADEDVKDLMDSTVKEAEKVARDQSGRFLARPQKTPEQETAERVVSMAEQGELEIENEEASKEPDQPEEKAEAEEVKVPEPEKVDKAETPEKEPVSYPELEKKKTEVDARYSKVNETLEKLKADNPEDKAVQALVDVVKELATDSKTVNEKLAEREAEIQHERDVNLLKEMVSDAESDLGVRFPKVGTDKFQAMMGEVQKWEKSRNPLKDWYERTGKPKAKEAPKAEPQKVMRSQRSSGSSYMSQLSEEARAEVRIAAENSRIPAEELARSILQGGAI